MTRRVLVIGAGASGLAAAWAAARDGAEVLVVADRPGATELGSGAVDASAVGAADAEPLAEEIAQFCAELGLWAFAPHPARLVTEVGLVRAARGREPALLDLEPLAGARIAVVGTRALAGVARLLARSLAADPWTLRTRTDFASVEVELPLPGSPRGAGEGAGGGAGAAARFVEAIAGATGPYDACLCSSALGLGLDTAAELSAALSKACGEPTSPPGGRAGARFTRARERLLAQLGVPRVEGRVVVVKISHGDWSVDLGTPDAEPAAAVHRADAVVLAMGGLVAGGLELGPAGKAEGIGFRLGCSAPVRLALDGQALALVAAAHGPDFVALGRSALLRVGIAVDAAGCAIASAGDGSPAEANGGERQRARGPWAAGECVAERPRTLLEAVRTGLRAGHAAAL